MEFDLAGWGRATRGRWLAAIVAAAACTLTPRSANARQEGEAESTGPEIEAVTFIGARSLATSILRGAILTQPTRCRNALALPACLIGDWKWAEIKQFLTDTAQAREDAGRLETLYEIWGYPDAVVRNRIVPQSDGDVVVEFRIDEGAPLIVRSIEVRGLEGYDPPIRLPRPLPLAPGQPYALPRLEALQRWIREALAERSQPYAQIEISGAVDEVAKTATIALDVAPGPHARFGEVNVRAERPIRASTVLDQLAYERGDPFKPSRITESERRLYGLPIVERAAITVSGMPRGDTVIGTMAVVDARKVHGVHGEGTVSSSRCLEVAGFWQHRYFLGGPRLFAIGAGLANLFAAQTDGTFPCSDTGDGDFDEPDYMLRMELWQPSFLGSPRNTLTLAAFGRRESAPNVYIEEGYGGRIAVSRDLGHGLAVQLDYTADRNRLLASEIYFCANYGVCTADGIDEFTTWQWLAPPEAIAIWRSSEQPADVRRADTSPGHEWVPKRVPDWRYNARLALQGGASFTASDYDFGRGILEASATRTVGRTADLAARIRLGGLGGEDVLPPQIRLYSGGVNTVRGLEQNMLGPKVLVARDSVSAVFVCAPLDPVCNAPIIDPGLVSVRPTGGNGVVEANLEARLWVADKVQLAGFLDFGWITRGGTTGPGVTTFVARRESILTPGVGIRVISDIGPIRVDVGYDPSGSRVYPLVADDGAGGVAFVGKAVWDPYAFGNPSLFQEFRRRLQLHMSIGQAF